MVKKDPRLSHQTLRVLRVFLEQQPKEAAGSDICKQTRLLSGTLYPILMRLERSGWLKSRWEQIDPHDAGRPRRRLYLLTSLGYNKTREALSELGCAGWKARVEVAISLVLAVLLVEAYAWLPKISDWLVERAVSRLLAEEDQARCREEWKASLDALPNSVVKLRHALSFCFAPQKINANSMQAKLEQLGYQLEALSDKHSCNLQGMRALNRAVEQRQVSQKSLERKVDETVAYFKTIDPASHVVGHAPNSEYVRNFVDLFNDTAKSFDRFGRVLVSAVNRLSNLTDSRIERVSARIEQGDILVRTIVAKHADANELFRKGKLPELTLVLKNLNDDLETLAVLVEHVVDAHDDSEFRRIATALGNFTASNPERKT